MEDKEHSGKIVRKKIVSAPADGNCLFWAVCLSFLVSAKDDSKFQERFVELFVDTKVFGESFLLPDTLHQCFPKSGPRTIFGPQDLFIWSAREKNNTYFQPINY
jgi:hypothetical protein